MTESEVQPSPFADETVGSVMSTNIPTCRLHDTHQNIIQQITSKTWESIHDVYVIDANNKLHGSIRLQTLLQSEKQTKAADLMKPVEITVNPHDDQELAVFVAVKSDVARIVVVDEEGHFLGIVSSHTIINVMHEEHLEDTMLTAGIHGKSSSITKLATSRLPLVVGTRAPWLIAGGVAGLCLGLISSFFETSLTKTVAIAYFIPVVAYIADSVGTQSEAIVIRALAVMKINYTLYLLKELAVGFLLGIVLGVMGGIGAFFIAHSFDIALVVALSLLAASTIAATMASLIPITFKALGKDPALGSGPVATAVQDVISVLIYFLFAITLIH